MSERKISVSTLLNPETVERLDALCREKNNSLSGIIREAVEKYLKGQQQ